MGKLRVFLGSMFYNSSQYIQFKRFVIGTQKLVGLKSGWLALFSVVEFCTSSVVLKIYGILKVGMCSSGSEFLLIEITTCER